MNLFQKRVPKTNKDGNASYTEKYQEHIPCCFTYKIVCIDDRFSKPVALNRGKNRVHKFIAEIPDEYEKSLKSDKNTL